MLKNKKRRKRRRKKKRRKRKKKRKQVLKKVKYHKHLKKKRQLLKKHLRRELVANSIKNHLNKVQFNKQNLKPKNVKLRQRKQRMILIDEINMTEY